MQLKFRENKHPPKKSIKTPKPPKMMEGNKPSRKKRKKANPISTIQSHIQSKHTQ